MRAELALDDATSHLEFEVHAKEGSVRILGALSNMREAGQIRRIATGVPGVVALNLDELASPVRA